MRTESEPRIHELRVDATCAYRVYEVDHGNLEVTCHALARWEGDGGHAAPVIVSHMPLSSTGPACLPMHVPWLVVSQTLADTLQDLRESLVEPILCPGMLGVDFADYAKALSQGGEIRVWSTRGQDGAECVAHLPNAVECGRSLPAACLHIRVPARFGLSVLDGVIAAIERRFPSLAGNDCLLVIAATPEVRTDVVISLLIVSGSR